MKFVDMYDAAKTGRKVFLLAMFTEHFGEEAVALVLLKARNERFEQKRGDVDNVARED